MNKKRTATSIGLGLLLAFVAIPAFPFQSIKQFEETSYYLKDVNFISEKVGWAVGEPHWDQARKGYTGTIIKTVDGGGTWVAQAAGTSQALRGVKFVDANNGWAVGVNGTILHTSDGGKRWVKQPVATTDEFRGVVFVNATQGWATSVRPIHYDWRGNPDNWRGSIWHTVNGGTTWYLQAVSSNASILNRIEFIDAKKGWAVGVKYTGNDQWGHPKHQPVVYHTRNGGLSWPEQFSPALAITLTGVDFVDANNGWAVGFKTRSDLAGGTVFHTTNGGTTWTRRRYPLRNWSSG